MTPDAGGERVGLGALGGAPNDVQVVDDAVDIEDASAQSGGRRFAPVVRLLIAIVLVLGYTWESKSAEHQSAAPAPAAPTSDQLDQLDRPFSTDSFWNTPLADDVPLTPDSNVTVRKFNSQWQRFYGTVGINTDDYAISIYRVGAGQATTKVTIDPECSQDPVLVEQLAAVPIPTGAAPASGGDASLVIWQPSTDTEWELWQARVDPDGNWSACWGGRITDMRNSNGVFPYPYGLSATGLAYLGGAIKVSELKAGQIDHVISVSLVETLADVHVPPASRNDGRSSATDAIAEGTRFRLDPTIDVTTLGLAPRA